jgi:hypothetical protein
MYKQNTAILSKQEFLLLKGVGPLNGIFVTSQVALRQAGHFARVVHHRLIQDRPSWSGKTTLLFHHTLVFVGDNEMISLDRVVLLAKSITPFLEGFGPVEVGIDMPVEDILAELVTGVGNAWSP